MNADADTLMKIIRSRRSIRQFSDEPVKKKQIEQVIDAGRWAPSACNLQHWLFVAITKDRLKERLAREGRAQKQITTAPVLIAVFCDMSVSPENDANIQSCAAAIENMSLMAYALGLGTTWIAGFDKPEVIRKILNVPQKYRTTALLMLGYPKEMPNAPPRNDIRNILHYNIFKSCKLDFPASLDPKDWTIEQLAAYQGRISRRGGRFEYLNDDKIDEIFAHIKTELYGKKILDLYSFSGLFLSRLQKLRGAEVYGQFMSNETIESAVMYSKNLSGKNTLAGIDIKLKNNEVITFTYRLEHMPSKKETLKSIYNALSAGGKAIIIARNKASWYGLWDALHYKIKHKFGISSRYFLGLQHMGPWELTTPSMLRKLLCESKFRNIRLHGKYIFPVSELINTTTFKSRFSRLRIFFKPLKLLDNFLEAVGLCSIFGETLIAVATK